MRWAPQIGAPTSGPVIGAEDVDAVIAKQKEARVVQTWEEADFLSLDPEHPLSGKFYAHLFSHNPDMVGLFWRFNL